MGDILFIRVSAVTFDEKDVLKRWPALYAAVWPDAGAGGMLSPAQIVRKYVPAPGKGVLELVREFGEYVRFGDMTQARRKQLAEPAELLEALLRELEEALGNRNVPVAHALTLRIEEGLDAAENAVREPA